MNVNKITLEKERNEIMTFIKQLEYSFNDSLERIKFISELLNDPKLKENDRIELKKELKIFLKLNKQFAKELESRLKGH